MASAKLGLVLNGSDDKRRSMLSWRCGGAWRFEAPGKESVSVKVCASAGKEGRNGRTEDSRRQGQRILMAKHTATYLESSNSGSCTPH